MSLYFRIILFCAILFLQGEDIFCQLILPINKNGNWHLKSKETEIKLPSTYGYVGNFNSFGTTFFEQVGYYGILKNDGKEIFPATFLEINQFSNNCYVVKDSISLQLIKIDQIDNKILCDSILQIENNWVRTYIDSNEFIVNLQSFQRYPIKKDQSIIHHVFDYILVSVDSTFIDVYMPDGKRLGQFQNPIINYNSEEIKINDTSFFQYGKGYFSIKTKHINLSIDEFGEYQFPKGASKCSFNDFMIQYNINGTAYIIDIPTRKVKISYPCDWINAFDDEKYLVFKNEKVGLIDNHGKLLLPIKFDYLYQDDELYFVYNGEFMGIYDSHYKEIFPCKYNSIKELDNFYELETIDYFGLYSKKKKKEILSTVYDKIIIENNIIKAWNNTTLSIIEINENHDIINKILLENAITVGGKKRRTYKLNYDVRLLSLGWHFDTISVFNKKSEWIRTKMKWGLKNQNDSVLIKPNLNEPVFIKGAKFSLLENDRQKNDPKNYSIVFIETGKINRKYNIISIDTFNYHLKNYYRFTHYGGVGIIKGDSVSSFKYMDIHNEELTRYCIDGNKEYCEANDRFAVPIIESFFCFDPYVESKGIFIDVAKKKTYYYCKFNSGQWNFLDSNGNQLFASHFEFADPFYKGTAIVKTKTGWGVVDRKGFIIEPVYTEINRIKSLGDTVFMVKSVQKGSYYSDGNFKKLNQTVENPEKQKGNLLVFEKNGKRMVCNRNHDILAEDLSSVRLHEYNRFVSKTKKVYSIFDDKGSEIGSSTLKPEEFLNGETFTTELKSKLGVLHVDGDTLVPFDFKEITRNGNWFIAKNKEFTQLYNADWRLVKSIKGKTILHDPIKNGWIEIQELKHVVFDSTGKKLSSFTSDFPVEYFYNDLIFSSKNKGMVLNKEGKVLNTFGQWVEFIPLENHYFILKGSENSERLFDANGNEIQAAFTEKKKIKFVSESIISFTNKRVTYVYNIENDLLEDKFTRVIGTYTNGKLLVTTDKKGTTFQYIDVDFKAKNPRKYIFAKPYVDGIAAVKFPTGWTVIDTNGIQRSFPSFGEIEVINSTLFSISNLPKYGVFTHKGENLIPVENEKIEVLPSYFRLLKNGDLLYTNLKGKLIF